MVSITELEYTEAGSLYYIVVNVMAATGEFVCDVNGVRAILLCENAIEWVNEYLEQMEWDILEEEVVDNPVIQPRVYMAEILDPAHLPNDHSKDSVYLLFIPTHDTNASFKMTQCTGIDEVAYVIEQELFRHKSLDIENVILTKATEVELVMAIPSSFEQGEYQQELTGEQ
jgi:hypothetical protein